ncbi:MAG TPA: methyltransferase domain-containing protein [Pseudonocardiaceae bacterium]|jgi:ubiquinone/menaquinone biosynthesis C-methylase UbiE
MSDASDPVMPNALKRTMHLLTDPPADPDTENGYLNLLGPGADPPARNNGQVQQLWASEIGSQLYDIAQGIARRVMTAWQLDLGWLNLPADGIAVDVGSGPGNITAALARAAGPDSLAIGVDISEAMLARAVAAEASANVGFVRADAQRLPLRTEIADAVVSMAALQLIPDPAAALREMVRVLGPGGRLAIMVPTSGPAALRLAQLIPDVLGVRVFDGDEIADGLLDAGLSKVKVQQRAVVQWVRGSKA